MTKHGKPNALINETSPYLLQHAYNPVKWMPWGNEAFEKAQKENKPLIISIGYASCHWCHVMEKECFEDEEVARLMNEWFVPVKVDREEHPDVDNLYMDAVQLLTGQGGWPLNVFVLPDGRPFYGGTYFPKKQWIKVLEQIHEIYSSDPRKIEETAAQLTLGVRKMDLITLENPSKEWKKQDIRKAVKAIAQHFDTVYGGLNRAPKFPLPSFYGFLLDFAILDNDAETEQFVQITLQRMALGGIYDHVGGGFARYSTDIRWKVPHFEKMLYDNAQLITLYARAYCRTKKELYRKTLHKTIQFLENEMQRPGGGFYAALDADSEGEEGKYYTWTEEQLKQIIPEEERNLFFEIYHILPSEKWENRYVLHREHDNEYYAEKLSLSLKEIRRLEEKWMSLLLRERKKRVPPQLDDKILTGWNALMITALSEAYLATGEQSYLHKAMQTFDFLWTNLRNGQELYHSYQKGQAKIPAFSDDYALLIQATLKLFSVSFEETYLRKAIILTKEINTGFYDDSTGFFLYRNKKLKPLAATKREIYDNVIPATNSVMAENLKYLAIITSDAAYERQYIQMLENIYTAAIKEPYQYSYWLKVFLGETYTFYEIVFAGEQARNTQKEFCKQYYPNVLMAGMIKPSDIPLLKNRFTKGKTFIYICKNQTCNQPLTDVEKARLSVRY